MTGFSRRSRILKQDLRNKDNLMPIRTLSAVGLTVSAIGLAACGGERQASARATDDASPPTQAASAQEPATPTLASATREDVADAIGCHLIVSSAMAAQMTGQDVSTRRYGPSLRYWHAQIEPRTQAAGLSEAEAQTVREEVVIEGSWGFHADNAESVARLDRCYNETPPGAQ